MFKKILCILLVLLQAVSLLPAFAADDVSVHPECSGDSYIVKHERWSKRNYGGDSTMLFGTVYDRVAVLKFDLGDIDTSGLNGALLDIFISTPESEKSVFVYSISPDWQEKTVTYNNFSKDMIYQSQLPVDAGSKKYKINLNGSLARAKQAGHSELAIALTTDASCMSAYSSENSDASNRPSLTLTKETAYARNQIDTVYTTPSTQTVLSDIKANISSNKHPYIYASEADFEEIREYGFGKDEILTAMYTKAKVQADKYLTVAPVKYVLTDRILDKAVTSIDRVMHLALVYRVEKDERYAKKAWEEMQNMISLEHWHQTMLDNSSVCLAMAIGYDWLYDWLTPEQREASVEAMKAKSLDIITDIYTHPEAYVDWRNPTGTSQTGAIFGASNHNSHDNTHFLVAALAIADVEPEYSAYIISNALSAMEAVMNIIYPDGACFEGTGYWAYIGAKFSLTLSALSSSLGTMYDYEKNLGIANTGYFPVYMQSSVRNMIYNDMYNTTYTDSEEIYFLGKVTGDMGLQKLCIDRNFSLTLMPLWYDVTQDFSDAEIQLDKDKLFRNVDVCSMRDTWEGNQEIFTGFRHHNASLSHQDAGSGGFALDAFGERWVSGLGREDYNMPGYWENAPTGRRWTYYARRPESNNCVVINPSEEVGQNIYAYPAIISFISKEKGAIAISDLTEAYDTYANDYKRGVTLYNNRTTYKVQDEMQLKKPSEVYWFMNLETRDIEVSSDGKSVIARKNGKMLHTAILANADYEIEIMESVPLPTSPNPDGQTNFRSTKKIALHFKDVQNLNITAVLTPILSDIEIPTQQPTFEPMDSWQIPDGEYERIMADNITVGGETIENFNPYNRYYEISRVEKPSELSITGYSDKYNCETRVYDNGSVDIIVSDRQNPLKYTVYRIDVKSEADTALDLSKFTEKKILSVSATEDDGNVPENVYDNNYETRWSAEGEQSIVFDIGESQSLAAVGVAFYQGTIRKSYFEIYVSNDGVNWTFIKDGESSGKSDQMEYITLENAKGRYIKYAGFGNSTSKWNSISEVKIYSK